MPSTMLYVVTSLSILLVRTTISISNVIQIPTGQRLLKTSPVLMMKAKKNQVEADGMMNAHLKDAVALCDVLSLMAEEIPKGIRWDEVKVSTELLKYRSQQAVNQGASFDTIGMTYYYTRLSSVGFLCTFYNL